MNVRPSVSVIDAFSLDGHVSTERPGLQNKDLIAEIGPYLKDPDFLALYTSNGLLKAKLHAQLEARHERHQRMLAGQVLVQQIWNDAASLFQADRVVLTGERILDQYDLKSRDNLPLFDALLRRAISHMPDSLLDLTIRKMSELRPEDIQTLMLNCAGFSQVDLQTLLRSIKTLPPISARRCLSALIDALMTANTLNEYSAGALLDRLKNQPKEVALPTLLHLLHAFSGHDDHESALRRLLSEVQVMSLKEAECVQLLMWSSLLDRPENAWCLDMLRSFCREQPREFQAPLLIGEAFALQCLDEDRRFDRFSDIRSRCTDLSELTDRSDVGSALAANIRYLPAEYRCDAIVSLANFYQGDTRSALFLLYNLHESVLDMPPEKRDDAEAFMEVLLSGCVLCFDKPEWPPSTPGTRRSASLHFQRMMIAAKATIECSSSMSVSQTEAFKKWGSALSSLEHRKGPIVRRNQSLNDAFYD